jgi:hypothetical protein
MWSHGVCAECDLFKGRGGQCSGYPDTPKDQGTEIFQTLLGSTQPTAHEGAEAGSELKIRLKLVDKEDGTSRICGLDEAKTWDWSNPEIMRVIGDFQITSFEQLLFMLREKEEKGIQEVTLMEAPRFMMLAGG